MLPSEIAKQVKRIQLTTGRQVADVLAGGYLSVFKGRGMEFDEVRPYVPGDDVRTIDWNVTARIGAPYVKRYVEERQLTVLLLVDVSPSLDFGSKDRSKREAAAELSALIAFSAIQNDDKVGLLLFHGEADEYIPPRKGQKHALRVVREVLARGREEKPALKRPATWPRLSRAILQKFLRLKSLTKHEPKRATNIRYAMEFCRRVLSRKAVLFLISDFIDDDYMAAIQNANRKHDVVSVLITDERERDVKNAGLITLQDAETGRTTLVDTASAGYQQAIADIARDRIERLRSGLSSSGIDLVQVDATRPVIEPLVSFFRMRQRRLRR